MIHSHLSEWLNLMIYKVVSDLSIISENTSNSRFHSTPESPIYL